MNQPILYSYSNHRISREASIALKLYATEATCDCCGMPQKTGEGRDGRDRKC